MTIQHHKSRIDDAHKKILARVLCLIKWVEGCSLKLVEE